MAHDAHQSNAPMIVTVITVALIAFGGGFFVGSRNVQMSGPSAPMAEGAQGAAAAPSFGTAAPSSGAAVRSGGKSTLVDSPVLPVGNSYIYGNPDAPVTIVEFTDFQCPFCARGATTIKQVAQKYPNDVRIVLKHFPLNFHKEAEGASKAALAAGEQGKFWEMHDILFENQKSWGGQDMKAVTTGYATQLGLDVERFQRDYDNPAFAQVIKDDMAVGGKVGVRGTPHFFVNGRRISGAVPIDQFEKAVQESLAEAKELVAGGTPKNEIYKAAVAKNYKEAEAPKPQPPAAAVVEHIPVRADDPVKGEKNNFLVTIVEFSDFQCPFCSRVNPTLKQIEETFPGKVRIVFKQNPLDFHKEAEPAARAALAAGEQGKFWEMHDLLFANQARLKEPEIFTQLANQLGLNIQKFEAAFNSDKFKNYVKEDLALGAKVGARGTPNFFINGVQLVGAQPFPAFEAEIKKQIEIAEKLQKEKGIKGEELYKAVVDYNKANAPKAPAEPDAPADKVDPKSLVIGNAYTKGPANAPVTIFAFSEFQCPFCSRGKATLDEVVKNPKYEGKIKVVFKSYPLPFHQQAKSASVAAYAAGKQGKFWEMHDLLFANQGRLKEEGALYTELAKQLGLNMDKFAKDSADPALAAQVDAEMAEGSKVGVQGTPTFFINGKRLVGAQPAPAFEAAIDAALSGK
jgi:protein-disulfide isomerase